MKNALIGDEDVADHARVADEIEVLTRHAHVDEIAVRLERSV